MDGIGCVDGFFFVCFIDHSAFLGGRIPFSTPFPKFCILEGLLGG